MGILSGIGAALRLVADQFPDPNAKRDPSNPRYWADMGTLSVAGVSVTERKVSQLGAVQAVRYGLSSAMSSLPVMVFRRGRDGAREPLPDHPLSILLGRRPNDRQTPAEVIGEIAWHLSYWRNAYCRIVPGDDPTKLDYAAGELEIIHPRRLTRVERRADGYIYYTFNPPQTIVQGQALQPTTYREDEIWHLRGNPLTEDGLLGQPVWESAREVFGRAIAVHEYGDIWFFNSGQTGGIIEHPGNFLDQEQKNKFLETWRSAGTGRNRHRDKLLTHGAKYTPLKVTNAEAQLLDTEKNSDIDVFGLWSFPPHRAGRLDRAAVDAEVASIVLDIDSPGGTVSGTPEAAAAVRDAAAQKPVIAIANALAASAAYWIGSQASEFVMAPSADVGSIGVMFLHQDVSGYLDRMGVKLTMIRSEQSPLKNEVHPFGPLSEDAQAFLQQRANEAGADFIKAVASGRRVTQTKVREDFGQGRAYGAREAVARGMADRIATLDEVIAGLAQKMPTRSRRRSALTFE